MHGVTAIECVKATAKLKSLYLFSCVMIMIYGDCLSEELSVKLNKNAKKRGNEINL